MHVFMAKNSVRKTKQESDGVNTSLFRTRPRNICFAHTCIQQEGSTCFDAHDSTSHMQMHCSLCRLRHSTLFTACLYKHFLPCFRILSYGWQSNSKQCYYKLWYFPPPCLMQYGDQQLNVCGVQPSNWHIPFAPCFLQTPRV